MSIFSHTFEDPESGDRATLLRYFNGYDYRAAGYIYYKLYMEKKLLLELGHHRRLCLYGGWKLRR